MKWLVLAVIIFAQQPTKAPESKGTAESNRTKSAAHTKQSKAEQAPSSQPAPVSAQSSVIAHDQATAAIRQAHTETNNQQATSEDRTVQRELAWFTGILAGVGVLQLLVMFFTLLVYKRQAREMRRSRHEMRRQRHVMYRQWKAMREHATLMQGQIDQMESAGKQTDQLIEQAKKQVGELHDAAEIALTNAENALLHTKVLVHTERPWVLIQESIYLPTGNDAIRRGHIYFHGKNWGKNPARVTRYSCDWQFWVWDSELPDEPTYHQTELKYPKYLVPNENMEVFEYDCASAMNDGIWDDMNSKNQRLLFIGHLVYFDLGTGDEHETRFCYSYTPHGTLILQGPRSYNRQT